MAIVGTVASQRRGMRRETAASGLAYLVLTALGLFFLAPFAWMVSAALNPAADLSVRLPSNPTLENFVSVMTSPQNQQALINGLILSLGAALVTMVCAALAAYPLSRYELRFKQPFIYGILFASALPVTAILVPVYSLFVQVNLVDSLPGTTLFLAASTLPFGIWMMKNFMDTVPRDLEEAAAVDGASMLQTLVRVVLPLMTPGLAVILIFTFIQAWGNFYVPFILLESPDKLPAAVTIYQFFSQRGLIAYGPLAAYSIIYSVPALLLYLGMSRFLGSGFALGGAVKG